MHRMTFRQWRKGAHVKGWHKVPAVGKRCAFSACWFDGKKIRGGIYPTEYRRIAVPGRFSRDGLGAGWSSYPAAREYLIQLSCHPRFRRLAA
ncbi:MAG: hypothetical protein IJT94_16290 [Oscillibacter sp.]|nr:hypothetical protein [Oscillibacter sp.]